MVTRQRQIPPERKALYYWGMALAGIGLLLFFSTFISGLANFGNFDNFRNRVRSEGFVAFGGMALMIAGGFLMNVGARGWAGSGVVLDPERARKDVEPWSRLGGGVVQDALSEVEIVNKLEDRLAPPEPQVKIRCRNCQTLNDERAKYCNQCGSEI
jgi:RNA polymerase subunit RPABC4/transcription elongation factor Spt4